MTQDEYLAKIIDGLNYCKLAIYELKLLDMVYEMGTKYSEENFDRMNLLVDCYRSRNFCSIEEIQTSLKYAEEYLRLSKLEKVD